ncbi:methyltransferase TYW3-domain-containing protein [Xylariaceae sp. FL0594]|nr:methyltransferase TYW3-domain-containing protein [Xylariaceae sp. FL0594]
MKGQHHLPSPPPASFVCRKERILEALAVPEAEYADASPKGSVDVGIRELIGEINAVEGFVTTSSCAGRVSVFVEGRKTAGAGTAAVGEGEKAGTGTVAAVGGKGGGGSWLFVSHDPVSGDGGGRDIRTLLGLLDEPGTQDDAEVSQTQTSTATGSGSGSGPGSKDTMRLIHFKFEPMILHVLTASPEHAQLLLRCGLEAGFRESGAINLLPGSLPSTSTSTSTNPSTTPSANPSSLTTSEGPTPIVAIRSMGLSLESLIGHREGTTRTRCTVSDEYLRQLLDIANERFVENTKRIDRFRRAFLRETGHDESSNKRVVKSDGTMWEDADARRERKRAEGLRRKAELAAHAQAEEEEKDDEGSGEIDLVVFPIS